MPLHIVRNDIVNMKVDAIVTAGSAMPGTPKPTGGVNGRIHRKAGARLLEAIRRLGGIRTGGAKLTHAYGLPCKYVIHTAGPIWRGGSYGEEPLLRACYREALMLADERGLESIAFPLISTGTYGYPKAQAIQAATEVIRDFLRDHDMTVYLVVYDREAFLLSSELFSDVKQFIDQHYVDMYGDTRGTLRERVRQREEMLIERMRNAAPDEKPVMLPMSSKSSSLFRKPDRKSKVGAAPAPRQKETFTCAECVPTDDAEAARETVSLSLEQMLRQMDEGFSPYLLRLIDERGMKDSECYKRANIDRKLFSKIRSNPAYKPSKPTVVAFCIALRLTLPQAAELLSRAGYALSHASKFDVIVEYFILSGRYDVHEINQVLFAYDMPLLGA